MNTLSIKRLLAGAVAIMVGLPAAAAPLLDHRTTANIGGSGYDAIDFYYQSSPNAEFLNYYLDFGTSNGSLIYDPLPGEKQDVGGDAIDTFMNTVGSLLGVSDAIHLQSTYGPSRSAEPAFIDRIEWDVFDLLPGDTNDFMGNVGSFHLARVLVEPGAMWHATFKVHDMATAGIGTKGNFTNDPTWTFPVPPPPPPPVNPVTPPPVDPGPVTPTPVIPPPPDPIPPMANAVVTTSTVLDVGGSGLNAIDFYYSSRPGAEFTNLHVNFRTEDGAGIYDPVPSNRQDAAGDAVDTFMNTVGSLLDLGNATHLYGEYDPTTANGTDPISKIEWDVFDILPGDTNDMEGEGEAPYHLARILVSPDVRWNATFKGYDTGKPGVPTAANFTNDPDGFAPEFVPPPVVPEPVTPDPVGPVNPDPPAQPDLPPTIDDPPVDPLPPNEPVGQPPVADPPIDEDSPVEKPDAWSERIYEWIDGRRVVYFPSIIDVPRNGWIEVTTLPYEEGDRYSWEWRNYTDLAVVTGGSPEFADDSFLVPTFDRTMWQLYDNGQLTTTKTATLYTLASLNGQLTHFAGAGVPEPSSALLASLALASLFAIIRRRPGYLADSR